MTDEKIRVLVVDDTVTYRKIVSNVLATMPGVEVVATAVNGRIALAKIAQLQPDILTLDLEMPEMDGLEVLRHLKESGIDVGAIVLSGTSTHGANATMEALELGAFDFVAKPVGATLEESSQMLQQELCPKLKAFGRTRQVHKILRGQSSACHGTATQPPAKNRKGAEHRDHPVVGGGRGQAEVIAIGISTGGPQALNRMLPQLPADLGVPVLLVQHMPPVFTKSLADDLNKRCALTISEAVDGQPVQAGHVLIAPGGKQMQVTKEGGQTTIRITDDPPVNSCRPSVDTLFHSVTRTYGSGIIGVIMTGMGNDGSQGCRQMKQQGAVIIAQDEASCVVFGMPREPVEEGIADVVAPLDEIATEIVRLAGKKVALCR